MTRRKGTPITTSRDTHARAGVVLIAAAATAVGVWGGAAHGQIPNAVANPVYADESPAARDAGVRVRELVGTGNLDEAARVVQALLDEQGERVIESEGDANVLVSVRERAHGWLRAEPRLLERYRAIAGPKGEALLSEGQIALVERTRLLTAPGMDAALRLAQQQIEDAEFEGARHTLMQIDQHPDAQGERCVQAATLWSLLERYLDRGEVRSIAETWRQRAKRQNPGAEVSTGKGVAWPELARQRAATPMSALPALDSSGLVSKPLWSVQYAPARSGPEQAVIVRNGRMQPNPGAMVREMGVMPSCVGDLVVVNDGMSVTAWDRFTLTPRWTLTPGGAPGAGDQNGLGRRERFGWGMQSGGDDPCTVSAAGRTVVVSTGRNPATGQEGDNRISGIDLTTGRLEWSVALNSIEASLEDAAVRGPVEIVGNTAIVSIRRLAGERRLISFSLAGLDVRTGAVRWLRMIGSTGSMPWVMQSGGAEACASEKGVVYRTDRLGVICAVEAASGRVRWIRRMAVDPNNQSEAPLAYQFGKPILDGETMVVLSPDGRTVLRVSLADGRMLAQRAVAELGAPESAYLIRAGEHLVGVCAENVHCVALATFDKATPKHSPRLTDDPGVRGRVVVAGGKVLVPTIKGVQEIDPAKPEEAVLLNLDATGNMLALESQVIVADEVRVHSFLRWDAAQQILQGRIRSDPNDPQPSMTLAELAFRAGKHEQIGEAVKSAVEALARAKAGQGDRAETSLLHDRLFEIVHAMVRQSVDGESEQGTPSITDKGLLTPLVERLGELAQRADQRVAHVLAAGRLAQVNGNAAQAAALYQSVLSDGTLTQANWRGTSVSVRGDLEATRRLEELIRAAGAGVYDAADAQARQRLAALGASASAGQLEALAQEFPFAKQTPGLWFNVAGMHKTAGNARGSTSALENGLRVAQRMPQSDATAVGQLGGALVSELRQRGQLSAAASVLRGVQATFPGVTLVADGAVIDTKRLSDELASTISASQRWPRVGQARTEGVQALAGWNIMEPLLHDATPTTPKAAGLVSDEEVALWSMVKGARASATLEKGWHEALDGKDATLVKLTQQGGVFLLAGAGEVTLVSAIAGQERAAWSINVADKVFPAEEVNGFKPAAGMMVDRFDTPTDRAVSPSDLLVSMDDRTIVLSQRSGRMAGIDLDTGEVLWTTRAPISRVHDCDMNSGWLAICGVQESPNAAGSAIELKPAVQVFDSRSGRLWQRVGDVKGAPSWVRLTEAGAVIVSSEREVACFDASTAQRNWTLTGEKVTPAGAAWVIGDHLVLLTPERKLVHASVQGGRLRPDPLGTPKSLLEGTRIIEVFPLNAGSTPGFGVATQQGVAYFSEDGALVGADGLAGTTALVPPRPAEGRTIGVETISEGRAGEGTMFFTLMSFETPTGISTDRQTIILGARPGDMMLMDERVLVSAGGVTVVIPAPVKNGE